ncbi:MAG: hypothetical protein JO147_11330 [Actinobacteria bacterium]|nr:hypothetical protein [Actinomycetota bacterium]
MGSNASNTPDASENGMAHVNAKPTGRQLDQVLAGSATAIPPLGALVEALTASPQPAELGGLRAASAAFASAPDGPTEVIGAAGASRSIATRLRSGPVIAVGGFTLAALAAGGVAFAAAHEGGDKASRRPALSTSAAPTSAQATATGPSRTSDPADTSGSGTTAIVGAADEPTPVGSPTSLTVGSDGPNPSLSGLCNAWLSKPHEHGNADNSAAFTMLVTAAGGIDAVDGYCLQLLGRTPSATVVAPEVKTPSATPAQKPAKPAKATPPGQTQTNGHGKP